MSLLLIAINSPLAKWAYLLFYGHFGLQTNQARYSSDSRLESQVLYFQEHDILSSQSDMRPGEDRQLTLP